MSPKKSGKAAKQAKKVVEERPVVAEEVEEESGEEESEDDEDEEMSGSDGNSSVEEKVTPVNIKKDTSVNIKKAGGNKVAKAKPEKKRQKVFWFKAFFNIIRIHGKDASISMAQLKEKYLEHLEHSAPAGQVSRAHKEWEKAERLVKKNPCYRVVKDRVEVLDRKTGQKVVFAKC